MIQLLDLGFDRDHDLFYFAAPIMGATSFIFAIALTIRVSFFFLTFAEQHSFLEMRTESSLMTVTETILSIKERIKNTGRKE
ncbi:hypothetical protein MRB53_012779 [Persea americana]|uniref:Uncharacterized protein n=1 Tax=Persea americana TaxID=3435 RepID=A0ACC2LYL0_PERAE|nr:hypothetical protein MRB53_012779 [Persea americana]